MRVRYDDEGNPCGSNCTYYAYCLMSNHFIELTGVRNSSDFQKLDRDKQKESLRTLRDIGASVRQLERLTGVSRGIIQFVKK